MLICRADLEAMVQIMDKFGLEEDYMSLDLDYNPRPASGYELSVSFRECRSGIVCKTTIEIDAYTREQLNEKV